MKRNGFMDVRKAVELLNNTSIIYCYLCNT